MATPGISKASVTTSEDAVDTVHAIESRDPIFSSASGRAPVPLEQTDPERLDTSVANDDVFGNEEGADIHYKTCSWW
jgi:hypothetical protein